MGWERDEYYAARAADPYGNEAYYADQEQAAAEDR